jgi:hypothetical protein
MSNHVAVVYVGAASATNLNIGVENRVWGFKQELMERSNYMSEFRRLEPGDLIFLGHMGGTNRVPPGGWNDKKVKYGYLGVITSLTENATAPVWPDDLYPYRPYFELIEEVEDFDATVVGTEVMEALRLSSNQQSRPVILPINFPLLGGGASATGLLEVDGALDKVGTALQRREQSRLRKIKLKGATSAACEICTKTLPVRHLRAAHIKKRSDCTDVEKLDLDNIMIVCVECDALFEIGDLGVNDNGMVIASGAAPTTRDLELLIEAKVNKRCAAWKPGNAGYFAHRLGQVVAA